VSQYQRRFQTHNVDPRTGSAWTEESALSFFDEALARLWAPPTPQELHDED
jgi:hypothetical protein